MIFIGGLLDHKNSFKIVGLYSARLISFTKDDEGEIDEQVFYAFKARRVQYFLNITNQDDAARHRDLCSSRPPSRLSPQPDSPAVVTGATPAAAAA